MPLSKTVATMIIRELDAVLPSKINVMDKNGVIIASSDPKRIGSLHGGAKRIIDLGLDELVVRFDGEYEGSLRGVNYPIVFQNEIAGVLGITGEYNEVKHNARIIKRMTELLMKDAYRTAQKRLGEAVRNRYIAEWLEAQPFEIDDAFINRGLELGIDITPARRIFVVKSLRTGSDELADANRTELAVSYVKNLLDKIDRAGLYLEQGDYLVCFVSAESDDRISEIAEELVESLRRRFGVSVLIGVDEPAGDYRFAGKSYRRALRALSAYDAGGGRPVRMYRDLSIELFSGSLSESVKREYIAKIFHGFTERETAEAIRLLETFYHFDGSISHAAEALFIHKNTLQYRLKRICERTGYDPRGLGSAGLFSIAIAFYRELKNMPRGVDDKE